MRFGKHCTRCHRDFHPSAFYPRHSWCKACLRLWSSRYHRAQRRARAVEIARRYA